MTSLPRPSFFDLQLPRVKTWEGGTSIAPPSHGDFTSRFGDNFPQPQYLKSDLGATAFYQLPPPSGTSEPRPVLIIHGLNTPAMGMLYLAREIQALDPDSHVVLYDLWGHGFSSTPLVAHTPSIFHAQILQILGFMQWTGGAHILGFSFGGSTAVSFFLDHPRAALSVVLLAPAGLLAGDDFSLRLQRLLDDESGDRETEAFGAVMGFLEGEPPAPGEVQPQPTDPKEVVAKELRKWELDSHRGYPHSVLSMFRHGGVYDRHAMFRKFAQMPVEKIGILGEQDPVCSPQQLVECGIENVEVVGDAGHGFVRSKAPEAARLVLEFWTGAS